MARFSVPTRQLDKCCESTQRTGNLPIGNNISGESNMRLTLDQPAPQDLLRSKYNSDTNLTNSQNNGNPRMYHMSTSTSNNFMRTMPLFKMPSCMPGLTSFKLLQDDATPRASSSWET